jgi:acyl-CoA synthetase (AMP-forming)/AMP-acid ligase II
MLAASKICPTPRMSAWITSAPRTLLEAHFGDRVVRCFAERPASVLDMFQQAVERNAGGEALVCGDDRLTWSDLAARVERFAAGLSRRGVRAGDRIALLLGNRIEFVLALLAAARLGAIAVPANIREQTPELAYVLNHCGAKVLVHEADLAARLPAAASIPSVALRVAAGAAVAGAEPFAALEDRGAAPAPPAPHEEDVAAIVYTSGTTGRPKGAMLTHLGFVHSAMHYEQCMQLGPADRSVAAVPLSHVTGLVALIATQLRCAGTLIVMPAFKASEFLQLAARERMTHTLLVPAMYNLCLLQPEFEACDLSAWRVGGYGGAPMPLATIERCAQRLPRLALMNCYGATETTSPATVMPAAETAAHLDSVGREVACAEIRVMDDQGREVAPGETGELWIRGPMVVPGYWNNPEATKREFTGGFWHSGDLGSVDERGLVRVFDRKKDMINRGGYKVYTAEVESALLEHPLVLEAAVVAKPCPVLGERVHAFVALREDGASPESLRAHCAARLADYKVPETWTLRREPLPRNANGKLIKRRLREELLAMPAGER